ncbi:MAG: S8 family serine peptidase [Verrucomicrobiota bacterium]
MKLKDFIFGFSTLLLALALFFFLSKQSASEDRAAEQIITQNNLHNGIETEESSIPEEEGVSAYAVAAIRQGFLEESLQPNPSYKESSEEITGEQIVKFHDDGAYRKFLESAEEKGFEIISKIPALDSIRVRGDADSLEDLLEDKGSLSPNLFVSIPSDPVNKLSDHTQELLSIGPYLYLWLGLEEINNEWGSGVTVAVLDNGIEEHAALEGVVVDTLDMTSEFGGQQVGSAMTNIEAKSDGTSAHGTAVASLIGGLLGGYKGLAPSSKIIDVRVLDEFGVGDSFTVASGLVEAVDSGAQIINMSLGSYGQSQILKEAVAYANAKEVVVVGASGNEGYDRLVYPARFESVLSVGAVDGNSRYAYFSNGGEGLDVVAPGVGLQAAWFEDGWISFSGTSASAAVVSGLVAAVASLEGSNVLAAQELVMNYLDEAGQPGVDPMYGSGIINMNRILQREERGLLDIAISSHYYIPAGADSNPYPKVQSVVQNRGTENLFNINHAIKLDGVPMNFTIPQLQVGEIAVHEQEIIKNMNYGGAVQITSQVSLFQKDDIEPRNNSMTSTLQKRVE